MLLSGSIKGFQTCDYLITVSMLCATLTNRGRHCWGTRTRLEVTACRSIGPDQRRLSTCNCCALSSPSFSHNPSIVPLQNISLVLQSDRFLPEQTQGCHQKSTNVSVSAHLPARLSLPLKASSGACCWGCLWGCPVPTGSRPPCCLPPRLSCGPKSEALAVGLSSQSRSSTLWPSQRRRARRARSCPRPAANGNNLQLGKRISSEMLKNCVSPRVFWRTAIAPEPSEFPQAAAGRVSKKDVKSFQWVNTPKINIYLYLTRHKYDFFPVLKNDLKLTRIWVLPPTKSSKACITCSLCLVFLKLVLQVPSAFCRKEQIVLG